MKILTLQSLGIGQRVLIKGPTPNRTSEHYVWFSNMDTLIGMQATIYLNHYCNDSEKFKGYSLRIPDAIRFENYGFNRNWLVPILRK